MKTKNKIPMRQCTGCREMKSKKEMLIVLKTTEDEIVEALTDGQRGTIIADQTTFYGTMGGQQDGIVVQCHNGKRLYERPGVVFFLCRVLRS